MTILNDPSNTVFSNVRVILYKDTQVNGLLPTFSTLLENTTSPFSIISPFHPDYTQRYKIMFDKVYSIVPNTERTVVSFTKRFRLNDTIRYSGPTTNVADQVSNAYYLVFFQQRSSTSEQPIVQFYTQLKFLDN